MIFSGVLFARVGGVLGLGDDFVAVYDVAKWPLLGLLLMLLLTVRSSRGTSTSADRTPTCCPFQ